MDYSNFSVMNHEISLVVVLIFVLLADLFIGEKNKKVLHYLTLGAFAVHTILGFARYTVGDAESFAGMYVTSDMHAFVKNMLNIGTLLVFMFAFYWNNNANKQTAGEFYFLTLSTLFGMYLMISSGNFLLFYIGLETASIPMATLVAFDKKRRESAEAAAKYVLTAAFSSGVMLFGISLIYATCGSLYFNVVFANFQATALDVMAMIFFIAGVGFKISLVPFHLWTADTYQGAPTQVSAFLSVISKGAAAFAFFCILTKVFPNYSIVTWQPILWWIIVITITVGNLFAIRQKNMKRFLAFSSISQAGYIMLGVIAGTPQGQSALVYYILVYLFTNLAAFGIISAIENQTGKVGMDDYDGLYSTNPKLAVVMMLAIFSLGGIPPFAGFFSKIFIFLSAAEQGEYLLVFIALLNTIISLYYYLLVVKAMFIKKSETPIATFKSDWMTRIALAVCTICIIALGIYFPIHEYIESISFGM